VTRQTAWILSVSVVLLAGCSAIVSPNGSQIHDPTDGGSASSDGGAGADTSVTPGDAGPTCTSGQIVCGSTCVSPANDVRNCGGCNLGCAAGETCTSGTCTCPAGSSCSGGPSIGDPNSCGSAGTRCQDTEFCIGGSCLCRPGLDRVSGACIDLRTDPNNCGSVGNVCRTGRCVSGRCSPFCPPRTRDCGGACVDVRTDTLNCGDCGRVCQRDKVCVAGSCEDYAPPGSCTSCPCPSCTGDTSTCCLYPGTSFPLCVDASSCG